MKIVNPSIHITGSFIGSDNLLHFYVDAVNFHVYPFSGNSDPTQEAVMSHPVQLAYTIHFNDDAIVAGNALHCVSFEATNL